MPFSITYACVDVFTCVDDDVFAGVDDDVDDDVDDGVVFFIASCRFFHHL